MAKDIKLKTLGDDDIAVLRELINKSKSGNINPASRPGGDRAWSEAQDWMSPEVYIARTTGIPAVEGSTPGEAECDLYTVISNELRNTGLKKRVLNFGESEVGEGYVPIMRDKFGRWFVVQAGASVMSFRAILFDKMSFPIGGTSDASEGGPLLWEDPLSDFLYGNCPPAFPTRLRGEFSWVQATEMVPGQSSSGPGGQPAGGGVPTATEDEDFGEVGVWMPKEGGWCGFKGECDAAHEYNRGNGNYHLERMTVEMIVGMVPVHGPCPDFGASGEEPEEVEITVKGRTVTAKRLGRRAWWNGNMPREDCADRYMITMAPDNEVYPS